VGAAYLLWLGLGLLREAWRGDAEAPAGMAAAEPRSLAADFRTGLLTNVLNPKVALFFLAFLPQFVPADAWSATASFLLLGAWFVVQGLLFLLVLVAASARLRRLQARPAVGRGLQALGGLLFVALALRLLHERPH
jgi:threonine/homoserine/homoserine lactone efflux protein